MLDSEFLTLCESSLRPLGVRPDDGEEFRMPPLDVLRYFFRPVRLSRIPLLGRGLSVVAVVRQPVDLARSVEGNTELIRRVATAVAGRYPRRPRPRHRPDDRHPYPRADRLRRR